MFDEIEDLIDKIVWGDSFEGRGALGKILATALRYLYAIVRDFFSGQLTMRAMSLVYTTLLSVVPLLAFSFAILKGFGIFNQLEPYLAQLLAPLGPQGEQITAEVLALVDNVKGSVLGGAGLVFFLYTAISTVQKVEESFNYTWYVSRPRSFSRRFTEYLIVLLVGPLLMVTAIGMLTSIQSNAVVQWILANEAMGAIFVVFGKLLPYLLISGVFTFLYMFMPNTKVHFLSALVGGVAGGFMWATVGAIFTNFILYASRTMQIYAGFAVAITTLIWLYLNWLILLIGAQLAFYHQRPAFLRSGRQEPRLSNTVRERVALSIMFHVGIAFRKPGENITINDLAQKTSVPSIALAPIVVALENAHLLKPTENEELVPGRDIARIKLADVVSVVRSQGDTGSHQRPRWGKAVDDLGDQFDTAIESVVGTSTLADMLDEQEQNA